MLFTTEPLSSLEALLLSFPICFPGVSIFFFFFISSFSSCLVTPFTLIVEISYQATERHLGFYQDHLMTSSLWEPLTCSHLACSPEHR